MYGTLHVAHNNYKSVVSHYLIMTNFPVLVQMYTELMSHSMSYVILLLIVFATFASMQNKAYDPDGWPRVSDELGFNPL